MKRPRLKRDWVGLTVKTVATLRNRNIEIPAGTTCTVTYNRAGLTLKTEPCAHCGVSVYIKKVPERDVDIVESTP